MSRIHTGFAAGLIAICYFTLPTPTYASLKPCSW